MAYSDLIAPEFDQEMATTRTYLARLPEGQRTWRPHEKSATLGQLAYHLVRLPQLAAAIFDADEYDLAVSGFGWPEEKELLPTATLLAEFDAAVTDARMALLAADDRAYGQPWTMRAGERVFFTLPRLAVVRSMHLSHTIHHRAQLGVYYRLLGIPVPATYGPSADETLGM
jgi:uncharacterized damage-inducible protein DinB